MFHTPDRSNITPNFSPTEDNDVVDIAWCTGVLSEGRPFRAEYWVQDQLTLLTFFVSVSGIENYSDEQLANLLEAENLIKFRGDKRSVGSMVIKDASDNEMRSITTCIRDPYETYLDTNLKFNNYNVEQTSIPEQELITPKKRTTEELEGLILNEQLIHQEWNSDFEHELERLLIINRLDVELRDNVDFDITSHLKNNELPAYKWLIIFLDNLEEGSFDDLFYKHIASEFELKKTRDSYVRSDTAQCVYLRVFDWVNIRFFHDENCGSPTPYGNFYLVMLEHLIKKAVQRVWDTR